MKRPFGCSRACTGGGYPMAHPPGWTVQTPEAGPFGSVAAGDGAHVVADGREGFSDGEGASAAGRAVAACDAAIAPVVTAQGGQDDVIGFVEDRLVRVTGWRRARTVGHGSSIARASSMRR